MDFSFAYNQQAAGTSAQLPVFVDPSSIIAWQTRGPHKAKNGPDAGGPISSRSQVPRDNTGSSSTLYGKLWLNTHTHTH